MVTDINSMLLSILPEIGLLVLTFLVLILDLLWFRKHETVRNNNLGWITFIGLLVVMAISLIFVRYPAESALTWGGMLRLDGTGFVFRILAMAGGAITVLFALDQENLAKRGEFFVLLLVSVLGMCLMASAADLIMLYLAIETTSIPLFVLAGFMIYEPKSVEAGVKYLLFGAMSSAIMLFGFTWLFGFTGTTQLYEIAGLLAQGGVPLAAVGAAVLMVLVGVGFKMSVAPMHFWAPDVYEGSPTPVAGFLSTASKAAGFAVLLRVMLVVFPDTAGIWSVTLAVLATASMLIGNFLALTQRNIKRLLAYSSIAQAGYILIGVASNNNLGISGTIYYLMAYLVTNLAAFGIVSIVGKSVGSDEIASYAGLSRRSPQLALAMLVAILSLGGIPPFAGFFGKLLVFTAAIQSGMVWLAFVGVANAVVGLYYYLNVLKVIYLYRSENEEKGMKVQRSSTLAILICIAGVLILGIVMAPWFGWASSASLSLISH
jgi:NADH-quinone oxidoreductase subunit N